MGTPNASFESLPSNLDPSKPQLVSTSNSGSFRSHLSTTNSQQRLRATAFYTSSIPSAQTEDTSNSSSETMRGTLPSKWLSALSFFSCQITWVRSYLGLGFTWRIFLGYCCLSGAVLTLTIFNATRGSDRALTSPSDGQAASQVSPLQSISTQQRLSRLFPTSSYPLAEFYPFFLAGDTIGPNVVSACLWSREQDLDLLANWASHWPGPISLVLTTGSRSFGDLELLLDKLQAMKTQPWFATLSVHLFRTSPTAQELPNMYLNFARLFSGTPDVVIHPGNLSVVPPPGLYSLIHDLPMHQRLVVLTAKSTSDPFTRLSPIFVPVDYPVWCTERFFFWSSRSADWEECLWQFSLETFGQIRAIKTAGLNSDTEHAVGSAFDSFKSRIRRRLTSRYRSETCDLMTKRISALEMFDEQDRKTKLQWLRKFCQETSQSSPKVL